MIVTFPSIISTLVDQDIIPYILKLLERNLAIEYEEQLKQLSLNLITTARIKKQNYNKKDLFTDKYFMKNLDKLNKVLLSNEFGKRLNFKIYLKDYELYKQVENKEVLEEQLTSIQVFRPRSQDISLVEPYWVRIVVVYDGNTHEFIFAIKCLALETNYARDIIMSDYRMLSSRVHRIMLSFFRSRRGRRFYYWVVHRFSKEENRDQIYNLRKIIYNNTEQILILSINEATVQELRSHQSFFQRIQELDWDKIIIDDPVSRRLFFIDSNQNSNFANIITYDSVYKFALGSVPETISKNKSTISKMFHKKINIKELEKIFKEEAKKNKKGK